MERTQQQGEKSGDQVEQAVKKPAHRAADGGKVDERADHGGEHVKPPHLPVSR